MALTVIRLVKETKPGGWERTVEVTEELKAPARWGMFTTAGNKSLQSKAQRCLKNVEKLVDKAPSYSLPKKSAVRKVLADFVAAWMQMSDTKSYVEAGDTAVREHVADFTDQVWAAVYDYAAWDNWEPLREMAYKKVYPHD